MDMEALEDLAFRGASLPFGLDVTQQMVFLSLRRLYAYAALVHMPQEQGKREKEEIMESYRRASFWIKAAKRTDLMWTKIEAAANQYGRDRSLENADAFVQAVYGVGLLHREEV